ncbi:uncharacterized protein LOC135483579 [Lineus longissimus]|uniref:uncharacterized protein LOC135483579 n=1 Tax=Lineus longissimus TaxID=88925 RepID=UPI002B4E1F42
MEDDYGTTHFMAGPKNRPSPMETYTSRDGMSHLWRGPGFYLMPERRFVKLEETTGRPSTTATLSSIHDSARSSASCHPERRPTLLPVGKLPPATDPWFRRWVGPGSGFYSAKEHKWTKEWTSGGAAVPMDSRLYINEEDWLKYKNMCAQPTLPGAH